MMLSNVVRKLAAMTFCIVSAGACGLASADTMTFDGIGGLYPDSYAEDGYIVTSLAEFGHLHAGSGNLANHSRAGSSPYHFTRIDGAAFDFSSFDYQGGESLFVTNNGSFFFINNSDASAHFVLPSSFQNIQHVYWYMTNPGVEGPFGEQWGIIDNLNLTVSAIPEPSAVGMLGLGLFGFLVSGLNAKRKQQA